MNIIYHADFRLDASTSSKTLIPEDALSSLSDKWMTHLWPKLIRPHGAHYLRQHKDDRNVSERLVQPDANGILATVQVYAWKVVIHTMCCNKIM